MRGKHPLFSVQPQDGPSSVNGAMMGTWGTGSFDNDQALDWAYGLAVQSDLSYIETTIDRILETGVNYLDGDAAQEAVAAADVIARLGGQPGSRNAYTEAVDRWVAAIAIKPPPELVSKAHQALARIRQPPSELLEGWPDPSDLDGWQRALSEVSHRLDRV